MILIVILDDKDFGRQRFWTRKILIVILDEKVIIDEKEQEWVKTILSLEQKMKTGFLLLLDKSL